MRLRLILPATLLLAALAAGALAGPAAAKSRYKVGIGEQSATMLDHPAFPELAIKRVRYLVPWDWRRNDGIEAEVRGYMDAMLAAGKEVFVTFTASRGCWVNNRYKRVRRCKAPSLRAYRRSFKAFRRAYPSVKVYSAWNEANHKSQPTARSPKRAAKYYNVMRRACRRCKIVALDVLDQRGMVRYVKRFRRYAKGRPRLYGLHNYSDVNRRRTKATRQLLRVVRGQVWLTETGGIVSFGRSWRYNERRAANRLRYMFKLSDRYSKRRRGMRSRITRIYPYTWFGVERGARFDAGMIDPDGSTRAGYRTFRKYAKRRSK